MTSELADSRRRFASPLRACLFIAGIALFLAITGCTPEFRTPIRVGVTSFDLSPLPPFLPKRVLFQQELERYLHEPVVFDLMSPRQIRVHLGTGRVKLAMLSAADYAEIEPAKNSEILAVAQNRTGKTFRQGLIVVSPRSRIQSVRELKGLRFHFLPAGDVLNEAAAGVLLDAGIAGKDIDRGILGLELDTSHISSLEVAKSVVLEEKAAGVIDEADYESWPDRGGSLVLLAPSKEQVRVIGKTIRVPEGLFIASLQAPAELREKMKHYLIEHVKTKKVVLGVLGVTGFAEPIDPEEYQPYFELRRKLHSSGSPATKPASASTKPAV